MKPHKYTFIIFLFVLYWVTFLYETDSYHSIYMLCALIAVINLFKKTESTSSQNLPSTHLIFDICSVFFSLIVILANWSCFSPIESSFFNILLVGIGGFCVAYNILHLFFEVTCNFHWNNYYNRLSISPYKVFLLSTLGILIIDLLYLFLIAYPGNLSFDSYDQMLQVNNGNYSNHHPFWHTMLIQLWYNIGTILFHTPNAGVAMYSIFQVICMAICFSYIIVTLYQICVPLRYITICYLWFLLMPFHIVFSVTMWKDVLFAACVSIFTTALFRIIRKIGKLSILNYIAFVISGIAFCLFRTNGWIAFILFTFTLFLFFHEYRKSILPICIGIIAFTYILTRPLMAYMNVPQADFIESLSIPAQQVAFIIHKDLPLTEEQEQLLAQIVDIDEIAEIYNPHISDPVKNAVRHFGNQQYLAEHKKDFFNLWISLGLEYPSGYAMAWIEQTKGFWNGGYPYGIFTTGVRENNLGIERICHNEKLKELAHHYFRAFEHFELHEEHYFLQFFVSIGFHVWIVMLLALYSIIQKKREVLLTIPLISIILTLMIATPVFSEFRYAYSIFTTLPLIIFATFYEPSPEHN